MCKGLALAGFKSEVVEDQSGEGRIVRTGRLGDGAGQVADGADGGEQIELCHPQLLGFVLSLGGPGGQFVGAEAMDGGAGLSEVVDLWLSGHASRVQLSGDVSSIRVGLRLKHSE